MKKVLLLMAFALPFVFISCGDDKDEPVDDHDDHEYVDLGLPSGTLWATCNIGANAPEEYGEYWSCTIYDCPGVRALGQQLSLHRPIGPCCACPAELAPLSRWLAFRFIVSI